jgi:hypothetical protein
MQKQTSYQGHKDDKVLALKLIFLKLGHLIIYYFLQPLYVDFEIF